MRLFVVGVVFAVKEVVDAEADGEAVACLQAGVEVHGGVALVVQRVVEAEAFGFVAYRTKKELSWRTLCL